MKKVFQLHDKFTEEVIGSVLVNDSQSDALLDAWKDYHSHYNSNSHEGEADIYDFEVEYGRIGFEIIEIDFI
jgi:hypothetical protein